MQRQAMVKTGGLSKGEQGGYGMFQRDSSIPGRRSRFQAAAPMQSDSNHPSVFLDNHSITPRLHCELATTNVGSVFALPTCACLGHRTEPGAGTRDSSREFRTRTFAASRKGNESASISLLRRVAEPEHLEPDDVHRSRCQSGVVLHQSAEGGVG